MDLLKILDQLRGNRELLMIALAIAFGVYNWGYLKSLLPMAQSAFAWLTTRRAPSVLPQPAAVGPVDDLDYVELQALKVIDKRMTRLKCKEGIAAIATVKREFFNDHSAEAGA